MQQAHRRDMAAMQGKVDQAHADFEIAQSRPSAIEQLGPLQRDGNWQQVQPMPTSTYTGSQQSPTVTPLTPMREKPPICWEQKVPESLRPQSSLELDYIRSRHTQGARDREMMVDRAMNHGGIDSRVSAPNDLLQLSREQRHVALIHPQCIINA